ncbi:hypothetical protein EGW08_010146 [Elysia chlorotica]|uniref:Uncharacterized protein n=1 Tax=Elysia chlorotica TaxID=188477 RepID=A0A3S1HLX8_ELYCH|nr:hypothetical protein EGW08_010146 [Elysia chlorotica]
MECLCSNEYSSCIFKYEEKRSGKSIVTDVREIRERSEHSTFICKMPAGNVGEATCRREAAESNSCHSNNVCTFSRLNTWKLSDCPVSCVTLGWYLYQVNYTYLQGSEKIGQAICESARTTETILTSTTPINDRKDPTVTIAVVFACIILVLIICVFLGRVIYKKKRRESKTKAHQHAAVDSYAISKGGKNAINLDNEECDIPVDPDVQKSDVYYATVGHTYSTIPDNAPKSSEIKPGGNEGSHEPSTPGASCLPDYDSKPIFNQSNDARNIYSHLENSRENAREEISRSILRTYDLQNFLDDSQPSQ